MAYLKKLFIRSKPRSSPRSASKNARKKTNKRLVEDQVDTVNSKNSNTPRSSTESAETDPSSDLGTVLDPNLFPQAMRQGNNYHGLASNAHLGLSSSRDSRYPPKTSTTPAAPPGLPNPPLPLNRPPHPFLHSSHPVPATPRRFARKTHHSNHDARVQMTDMGYEHDQRDELAPCLMALSETGRIKARTYMCYYNMRYKLSYASFRSYVISDNVKTYCQQQLKFSRRFLKASHEYDYTMNRRRRDVITKQARYKHAGTNIAKTLSRMDQESIKDERKKSYTFTCQPNVLQLRSYIEAQTQEQTRIKAAAGDTFEVNDYAWRSAKARKAWLLRSEKRLQNRMQGKGRDSLEGDGDKDSALKEREKRQRDVQSLAARRLHSSLTSGESARLQAILQANLAEKQAGDDSSEPLQKMVYPVSDLEHGALVDEDSGSEYSDSDDSSDDDSDAAGFDVYGCSEGEQDNGPSTARVVSVTRAASKVNMYTLKKGSASQDTIMPPK